MYKMYKISLLKDVNKLKLIVHPRLMSTLKVEFPDASNIQRGTGGRSSFNGTVATVFGSTQNLGRFVCAKLGKTGTQLVLPYRCSELRIVHLKVMGDLGQVILHPFHLQDEESLYKVMKYSNVVINLINRSNETPNFSFDEVNNQSARRLARIARECGVKRFIHVSALNACENPKGRILKNGSEYYRSKFHGEQSVREEFPSATILRPAWFYGFEDKFLQYYMTSWRWFDHKIPLWDSGRGIYKNPVFIGDVASAIVNSVFDHSSMGKSYDLYGPRRYELAEIVDYMYRLMRKDNSSYGYKRLNLKYFFPYWIKVLINEKIFIKHPHVSREIFEQEHTDDIITKGNLTMEDLGVQPTYLEDRFPYECSHFEHAVYFDREIGDENENIAPPIYVQ